MSATDGDRSGVVLVLGGTGALGSAIARELELSGRAVLVTGTRSSTAADRWYVRYRSGDDGDVSALRSELQDARLDAVVHCIGIASSKRALLDTPTSELEAQWRVNVLSFTHVLRALRDQLRRDRTCVAAVSSDATLTVRATSGPYSATKCALEALALTLAKEEAQFGVRVNVVAPSLVRSPLAEQILARKGIEDADAHYAGLPWGRPLSAREVARAVIAVTLSPEWSYATGQVFRLGAVSS